jgi:phosphomannomutase
VEQTADRIPCFMAYDIRGRIPDELDQRLAYLIGRAYAAFLKPKRVVVGRDVRLSSAELSRSLTKGLTDSGVDVFDVGLCGTEQIYFATFHKEMDGGIMVTASHNPPDYNGMKLVREESRPISGDSGLREIETMVAKKSFPPLLMSGSVHTMDIQKDYIEHLLSYVDRSVLKPFKVVVNAGNGCAGPVLDLLEPHLPFNFIKVFHEPDGTFPHGVPNPLLPENRAITSETVKKHRADIGIAWDGDFDRCFLFDENGAFIEGYYIVGLLAEAMLRRYPGAKIIHDPRLTWNTIEIVKKNGGIPVKSKTGHAFIKERMRAEDAVYGGEMSGHHYFRDFAYCDSGMIPWLSVLETMSKTGKPLSELVGERMKQFPASGEINRRLQDPDAAIQRVENAFKESALSVDYTDGVGMEFDRWRFNLRKSNTEPVLRLNVEAREDSDLMKQKTEDMLELIDSVHP